LQEELFAREVILDESGTLFGKQLTRMSLSGVVTFAFRGDLLISRL
jgi:hypothetical protein